MEAVRIDATIQANGRVILNDLPFEEGKHATEVEFQREGEEMAVVIADDGRNALAARFLAGQFRNRHVRPPRTTAVADTRAALLNVSRPVRDRLRRLHR